MTFLEWCGAAALVVVFLRAWYLLYEWMDTQRMIARCIKRADEDLAAERLREEQHGTS